MAGLTDITKNGTQYEFMPRSTAGQFSTSTAYAVGDYCYFDGTLYRCTTAHAAGAFVASHFTAVTIDGELKAKEAEIENVKSDLRDTSFGINKTFTGITSGKTWMFDANIIKGRTYAFTNNTTGTCTISGKKLDGQNELILQPVNVGQTRTFTATKDYYQIGGYFNGNGSITVTGDDGIDKIVEKLDGLSDDFSTLSTDYDSSKTQLNELSFGVEKTISVERSTSTTNYYSVYLMKGLQYTVTNNTSEACTFGGQKTDGTKESIKDGVSSGESVTFIANDNYVKIGGWFNASGTITVVGGKVGESIDNLAKDTKTFMYLGSYGNIGLQRNMNNGRVIFTIYNDFNFIVPNNSTTISISKADIVSQLPNYATSVDDSVEISIPAYRAWCFNTSTHVMAVKQISAVTENDCVIAYNGWGNPTGELVSQYMLREIESSDGNTNGTPYYDKMESYAKLLYGDLKVAGSVAPTDFENFVWFTDPHTMYGNYTYDISGRTNGCQYFDKYMSELEFVYNSTPTDFVLCGGDWNDGGLPAPELFKLSRAMETCKAKLSPFYNCVGNHDTNYQGKATAESATYTSLFSPECLKDLWYRDQEHCYYTFNGRQTKFYVLDTRTENGLEDTTYEATYLKNQLKWFADALKTDNAKHIALAMHIYYYTGTTIDGFANHVLNIACTYNARGTYQLDGVTYDYSSATGKIEFVLAGHSHRDYVVTHEYANEGIPVIATINAGNAGTNASYYGAEHCIFDLVHVNYDENVVKLIRIGNIGEDRTVEL